MEMRKRARREAAAIIKFRRDHAYSKSVLAKGFRRSTSFIQKILDNAEKCGILWHKDYRRNMPNKTRQISRALQWARMLKWLPRWAQWILGEEEKPP